MTRANSSPTGPPENKAGRQAFGHTWIRRARRPHPESWRRSCTGRCRTGSCASPYHVGMVTDPSSPSPRQGPSISPSPSNPGSAGPDADANPSPTGTLAPDTTTGRKTGLRRPAVIAVVLVAVLVVSGAAWAGIHLLMSGNRTGARPGRPRTRRRPPRPVRPRTWPCPTPPGPTAPTRRGASPPRAGRRSSALTK